MRVSKRFLYESIRKFLRDAGLRSCTPRQSIGFANEKNTVASAEG